MQHTKKGAIMEIVMTAPKKLSALQEKFDSEVKARATQLSDDPSYLQEHFVMIHGTNCAWDKSTNTMIKCGNMELSFPVSYKIWKSNPGREIVPMDDLVFAPQGCKKGQINMFKGLPMRATNGSGWKAWHLHLLKLCGNDNAAAKWITCWFAYQLQNLGSKMRSSVVIHGDEGTGKNILVDAIQHIFGIYGIQIGQSQIESQFNGWASCKLFIVANEVISRRERRHIKGKLQQLITEPFVSINQKSMPERIEANFANFVFLSNEDVPIDTNKDDRRFMVIKTQKTDDMDVDYFTELKSSIVESDLLGYLLNYDCGDFNEHTKPLLTDAKKDIIDANLTTEQNFIKQWLAGEAGFPVQAVGASSLYWAYQCWCAENGERFPSSSTTFGRAIASEKKIIKSYCSIKFTTKKVTAYFVGADTVSTTLEQEFLNQFDILVDDKKRKYHL
jgi:hypothetical protein